MIQIEQWACLQVRQAAQERYRQRPSTAARTDRTASAQLPAQLQDRKPVSVNLSDDTEEAHDNSSHAVGKQPPLTVDANAELSEEELLSWQPIFPAKATVHSTLSPTEGRSIGAPSNFAKSVAAKTDVSKSPSKQMFPTQAGKTLFKDKISRLDEFSHISNTLAGAARVSADGSSEPWLAESGIQNGSSMTASVQLPAAPSSKRQAALSSSKSEHSLRSSVPASSIVRHAMHAEPVRQEVSLPALPYSSFLPYSSSLLLRSSPAAAAPAAPSMSASIDSQWSASEPHAHRQSTSTWSSLTTDAHALRQSTVSAASRSDVADLAHVASALDGFNPLQSSIVPRHHDGLHDQDLESDLAVDWHKLDTAELHRQTSALLSSSRPSGDLDSSATGADIHPSLSADPAMHAQQQQPWPGMHQLMANTI